MYYEDSEEIIEYVARLLRQISREATVLLYSPFLDLNLEKMIVLADRVFCFYEMPKAPEEPGKSRAEDAGKPGHTGGVLMRHSWRQESRQIDPAQPLA